MSPAHFLDALDSEGRIKPLRLRDAALALADYATDNGKGRDGGDPVHDMITEGRTAANEARRRAGFPDVVYFSCGDFAHWLLMCLGCIDERLVNRSDDGGKTPWKIGANLSRIVGSAAYVKASSGSLPSPGDILFLSDRGGHVCVLRSWGQTLVVSDDYGQPYGKRRQRQLLRSGARWLIGGRPLDGWLDLDAVVFEGPAKLPGAVAEALGE